MDVVRAAAMGTGEGDQVYDKRCPLRVSICERGASGTFGVGGVEYFIVRSSEELSKRGNMHRYVKEAMATN